MDLVCLDLEGVLVPEIWISLAEATGIDGLRKTTRDIRDYDELMRLRLQHLRDNKLKIDDIQRVVESMTPLAGANEFVDWLRQRFQLVILSDTFYELVQPLMAKLGWPTLFCHRLEVGEDGSVNDYKIRLKDPKRNAVIGFKALNFKVFAAGDSYNDVTMLREADRGYLFNPPQNVAADCPDIPVVRNYLELQEYLVQDSDF